MAYHHAARDTKQAEVQGLCAVAAFGLGALGDGILEQVGDKIRQGATLLGRAHCERFTRYRCQPDSQVFTAGYLVLVHVAIVKERVKKSTIRAFLTRRAILCEHSPTMTPLRPLLVAHLKTQLASLLAKNGRVIFGDSSLSDAAVRAVAELVQERKCFDEYTTDGTLHLVVTRAGVDDK